MAPISPPDATANVTPASELSRGVRSCHLHIARGLGLRPQFWRDLWSELEQPITKSDTFNRIEAHADACPKRVHPPNLGAGGARRRDRSRSVLQTPVRHRAAVPAALQRRHVGAEAQ